MRSVALTELPGTARPAGDLEALLHHAQQLSTIAAQLSHQAFRHTTTRDSTTLIARLVALAGSRPLTARLTTWHRAPHDHPGVRALHAALLANPGEVEVLLPTGPGDDVTKRALDDLRDGGAALRRTAHPLPPLTVVDGAVTVVAQRGVGAAAPLVIEDARVSQTLQGLFTALWDQAADAPWPDADTSAPPTVEGRAHPVDVRAIRQDVTALRTLRLLATGATDDSAARQLGCSTRTYRRHDAVLMQQLGAGSRFQAGLLAAQHGLLATR